jgi:hypothetical protein
VDAERTLPIVCTLTPETLAARKEELLPGLAQRALSREQVGDGIRITFPADMLREIAGMIDSERQCCRFFRFELVVPPDGADVALTVSGPPGTRAFFDDLLT